MLSAGAAAAAEVAEAGGAAVEAAEGAAAAAAAVAAACRGAVAPSAKFHAVTLAKRQPPRTAGAFSLNRPSATPSGRVAQSAERVCEQHEVTGSKPVPRRQPQPTDQALRFGRPGIQRDTTAAFDFY